MNKNGPIIIIEDDEDDQELLEEIFKTLDTPNEVRVFSDGHKALEFLHLETTRPFIILSDINMPSLSGFELREIIQNDEDLRAKCIPYVFFTTGASPHAVKTAYGLSIQGFFKKPNNYEDIKRMMQQILNYWSDALSPGRF